MASSIKNNNDMISDKNKKRMIRERNDNNNNKIILCKISAESKNIVLVLSSPATFLSLNSA